jgi:hypothetical protein
MRDALYEQRVMGRDIDVVLNEAAAYFGALLIVVAKLQSGLDDDVEIHSVRLSETEENRES